MACYFVWRAQPYTSGQRGFPLGNRNVRTTILVTVAL